MQLVFYTVNTEDEKSAVRYFLELKKDMHCQNMIWSNYLSDFNSLERFS